MTQYEDTFKYYTTSIVVVVLCKIKKISVFFYLIRKHK